ncbi:MAPEG family protein [Sulfitobacter sp. D35]|uniref:MAPEG family protein n=1 Tax=Sulfitobacter sp. D35 TaxID=3083252 RepID=UPI00296F4415|nr:MAPEG family protein [Sulfitobacter sp. D35]MDW4499052.1 MAPEG family protein [Sulfitobacter sp. D35]
MTETTVLALYGLLVLLTLLLQVTGATGQLGIGYLMSSRDEHRTVTGMTGRLERALNNSITGMALFAPAVLILVATDKTSAGSLLAAQAFLLARVIYLPAYVFRLTGVRTLAWLAGFAATAMLYLMALR